ncbi:MAG: anthranilate synthase component I family protein [Planctomycetota bacterium]|nr:anthranilate synthase component I family protein [Planctomycetota bacterium]
MFDPLEALRRWPADRDALLLHSGRFHPRWARKSILTHGQGVYRFVNTPDGHGRSEWTGDPRLLPAGELTHKPFADLRRLLRVSAEAKGLWVGYLGYDLGRWIERLSARAAADRDWPIVELAWCPGWLEYERTDHIGAGVGTGAGPGKWTAHGSWARGGEPDLASAVAADATSAGPREPAFAASDLQGVFTRRSYEAAVAQTLRYIAAGDIFQANLAQRFTARLDGPTRLATRSLFGRLADVSPAWYGGYLEFAPSQANDPHRAIASTSPELFLEVDARGNVVTRPIKGTRPATVPADELRRSEKDIAELNMIVDLLRNDLGRVCAYGSVQVPEPRVIESHPTIHHGVATITGLLHPSRDVIDLLRATMPGGSITGAPKIRAMEIIDELEPVRRGPYCGAIGLLSAELTQFNIAIRTLLCEQPAGGGASGGSGGSGGGRVDFSVGGGIVADSDPGHEFDETLHKAAAMLRALGLQPPGFNG